MLKEESTTDKAKSLPQSRVQRSVDEVDGFEVYLMAKEI
jgi:hypothetical protein